jgi:two-component system chemotaxis response regulator CheB
MAIVQDPETAEVDSMPKAAIQACAVDHILSLEEISALLNIL